MQIIFCLFKGKSHELLENETSDGQSKAALRRSQSLSGLAFGIKLKPVAEKNGKKYIRAMETNVILVQIGTFSYFLVSW